MRWNVQSSKQYNTYKVQSSRKWMDGLAALETDTDRAAMKTPVTKDTIFVENGAANVSGSHTIYFQGCRHSLGNEVHKVICMLWSQILISPISSTEPEL